jgi:hypothetical protein
MSAITPQQLKALLPLACEWAEEQEKAILQSGEPLTQSQLADARIVGVKYPQRIRLLRVVKIPMPEHPALAAAAGESGLFSSGTEGMTLRYGIFIRADCWEKRLLHVHEFVHTTQYERLGGFEAFLDPYLRECFTPPFYPNGPMEQEAIEKSARVCGIPA